MASLTRETRGTGSKRRGKVRPSVREVCLLGVSRPVAEGDRVDWSGRSYRVEAAHHGYAHLAPEFVAAGGD